MKIKSLLIPIAVFIFFTSFCYSVYGQETQIDGKSYETIRKVNLTTDAEFVKLKQKSAGTASGESYIKVNNEYAKTSFTAAALKNFFEQVTFITRNGKENNIGREPGYVYRQRLINCDCQL